MKIRTKIFFAVLGAASLIFAGARAALAENDVSAGSIQAIQQAADPSGAVAAYANGIAADRNDPAIYSAYVQKMIEFGLPELAYHQALSLTTMQSDNGLGWGVVAYVDARRGQMPDAISAIVLAGQFAPESAFVQRTAGEIAAWYDLKADKSTLPDNTKDAMAKVRTVLNNRSAFKDAYAVAAKAYQNTETSTQPNPPPLSSGTVPAQPQSYYYAGPEDQYAPADYYPDYGYYDSGPGWVSPAPAPWWWWQPLGYFGGCDFFPFAPVIVFGGHGFFHHDFFDHDFHDHFHGGLFAHNEHFFHATGNGGRFFGSPARGFRAHSSLARGSDSFHFHGALVPNSHDFFGRTTSRAWNPAPRPSWNRSFTPPTPTTRTWNSPGFATRAWSPQHWSGMSRSYRSPAFALPRGGGFAAGGYHGGFHQFQGGGGFHALGGFGGGHSFGGHAIGGGHAFSGGHVGGFGGGGHHGGRR